MGDRNEAGIGLRLASGLLEIGCVMAGTIAGAFLGYRFSENNEAPAAWLTAGLLSLVFIARGMGIV